jgi:hypothetical protein
MSYIYADINLVEQWCERVLDTIPKLIQAEKELQIKRTMETPTFFLRRKLTREQAIKKLENEDYSTYNWCNSWYHPERNIAFKLLQSIKVQRNRQYKDYMLLSTNDLGKLKSITPF